DVIVPNNKTAGSTNPIYFDIDFETILANRLLNSDLEKKSYAYVGGAGSGSSRTIEEVFITASEPSGLERTEAFVDAGDLSDTANLQRKGEVFLRETEQENIVEVDINTIGSFKYQEDWNIGDNVTVINDNWDLQIDVGIVGTTIEVTTGAGQPQVEVQLGRSYPTIKGKVKRQIKEQNDERERS
ncbi:hypothetical protein, partial [Methanohalobium sp.]|uniref:Gp37-like protein n=1 Tax=Methanohalobium sp. TaxID=2837493 RepID=UPI0025E52DB3